MTERKKKLKPDDPDQYARFVKVAKDHLGEDAEEKLEEAMKKILSKAPITTKKD